MLVVNLLETLLRYPLFNVVRNGLLLIPRLFVFVYQFTAASHESSVLKKRLGALLLSRGVAASAPRLALWSGPFHYKLWRSICYLESSMVFGRSLDFFAKIDIFQSACVANLWFSYASLKKAERKGRHEKE